MERQGAKVPPHLAFDFIGKYLLRAFTDFGGLGAIAWFLGYGDDIPAFSLANPLYAYGTILAHFALYAWTRCYLDFEAALTDWEREIKGRSGNE